MTKASQKVFPFIKYRKIWYSFSLLLIAISIAALSLWGLKVGIDFTGGTLMEVEFSQTRPAPTEIKNVLAELNLGNVSIQPVDQNRAIIRLRDVSEEEHQQILSKLKEKFSTDENSGVTEIRFESIGPAIGRELRDKAITALSIAIIFIILYIAYAFRKVSYPVQSWKYGIVAILALAHDILITTGIFAVLGYFYNYEINILFITALLTILGYSVNDTIVVFDRTRENLFHQKNKEFSEVVNLALNQTLVRSINTSFTTLLVLFAIFLFGGETIKQFVLALIIGTIIGTYSSIFIASPLLVDWYNLSKRKRSK